MYQVSTEGVYDQAQENADKLENKNHSQERSICFCWKQEIDDKH